MDSAESMLKIIGKSDLASIVSVLSIIVSVFSFVMKVMIKSPIERLFRSSMTLFLDYLIKNSGLGVMITASSSLLGYRFYSFFLKDANDTFNTTLASNALFITLLLFLIGCIQYLYFTSRKKSNKKNLRWILSIVIFSGALLGTGITLGYFWKLGNSKMIIGSFIFFTIIMISIIIGLQHELDCIHKNRDKYVLRIIKKVDLSSLSHRVFHTQTIAKDTQIFEPPHNFYRKNHCKVYYVFYPREQFAIKYTWDKKTNPEFTESNLQA